MTRSVSASVAADHVVDGGGWASVFAAVGWWVDEENANVGFCRGAGDVGATSIWHVSGWDSQVFRCCCFCFWSSSCLYSDSCPSLFPYSGSNSCLSLSPCSDSNSFPDLHCISATSTSTSSVHPHFHQNSRLPLLPLSQPTLVHSGG